MESKTKCIVGPNEIILELYKEESEIWESLCKPLHHQEIAEKLGQVLDNEREYDAAQTKTKKGTLCRSTTQYNLSRYYVLIKIFHNLP